MRTFLSLSLYLASFITVSSAPLRIVGGSVTSVSKYPDIAAVLYRNGSEFCHICGGSILNHRSVLSAAHCIKHTNPALFRIRVGSSYSDRGGMVYNLTSIVIHPKWNYSIMDSDIAILHTATSIMYANVIKPASIAKPDYKLPDNQIVWAVGWGAVSIGGAWSKELRHVQVWTINYDVCNQRYGGTLTDNMLCSGWLDHGDRDQCTGDSGGPLYHKGIVVGISSFGYGCAEPRFPGINMRLSHYANWIQAYS